MYNVTISNDLTGKHDITHQRGNLQMNPKNNNQHLTLKHINNHS